MSRKRSLLMFVLLLGLILTLSASAATPAEVIVYEGVSSVDATWIGPKIDSLQVSSTTGSDGIAAFTIDKAFRGTYYFIISDVSLDGYEFDDVHSTTFTAFFKN
jgi:hypothetical protein